MQILGIYIYNYIWVISMLAKIIKNYRKTNNLTQHQLAEMLNVSRSAVAKWE